MNTLLPNSTVEALVKPNPFRFGKIKEPSILSALMILGGLVAWRWAVPAERKSLEMVARQLTFIDID
jgi:hypothetical protein